MTEQYNAKAEMAVLGALLIESKYHIMETLTADMFYIEVHQKVFTAIRKLFEESRKIDMLTVGEELLKQKANPSILADLTASVASSAHIEDHVRIIKEKAILRSLGRLGFELTHKSADATTDPEELLQEAESEVFQISNKGARKAVAKISDVVSQNLKKLDVAMKKGDGLTGVPTGFAALDKITGGWQPSDLIILAARPGQGKTSLGLDFAVAAAMNDFPVAFFSLEMSAGQLVNRLISKEAEVDGHRIMRGLLKDSEMPALMSAAEKVSGLSVYIDDTPGINIVEIKSKCRSLKMKYGIEMIVVDYIQLAEGVKSKNENRTNEVGTISRGLKLIAKELDVPVVALSQLSRAVETRGGSKRPQLSDLRDSGCLTGDTMISMPKGISEIGNMNGNVNFPVYSLTSNVDEKVAKKCFFNGIKPVFSMVLSNGMKIRATGNHKFLTQDGWNRVDEMNGNKIAVAFDYGDCNDVKISDSELLIVGHFIANGCAIERQPIHYTCHIEDMDLAENVAFAANVATNDGVVCKISDTITDKSRFKNVYMSSVRPVTHGVYNPLRILLDKYGLWNKRSKEKFIPDEFFALSHRQTCTFLRALFSGDGSAYGRNYRGRITLQVSYSSSSERLIMGVQLLLLKVGIICNVCHLKNKKGHEWYNLYIAGKESVKKFIDKIGFINKRKNSVLEKWWPLKSERRSGWTKYVYDNKKGIVYVPIAEIKKDGVEKVYDIEVPESHNFLANGIITHNSIEQDADVVTFIYRPESYNIMEDEEGRSTRGIAEIIFAKHRNGALTTEKLRFKPEFTKFEDWIDDDFPSPQFPAHNVVSKGDAETDVPF